MVREFRHFARDDLIAGDDLQDIGPIGKAAQSIDSDDVHALVDELLLHFYDPAIHVHQVETGLHVGGAGYFHVDMVGEGITQIAHIEYDGAIGEQYLAAVLAIAAGADPYAVIAGS